MLDAAFPGTVAPDYFTDRPVGTIKEMSIHFCIDAFSGRFNITPLHTHIKTLSINRVEACRYLPAYMLS